MGYAVSLSKLQDRIIAAAGVGDLGGTGQLAVAFPLAAFSARQVDIDGGVLNVQGARIVGSGGLGHTHILHVQRTGAGDGQASGVYTLDGIDGTVSIQNTIHRVRSILTNFIIITSVCFCKDILADFSQNFK